MEKGKIQAFQEANDEIELSELTDDELNDYYAICNNGMLDAMREQRRRGL